jgi:predicted P-type ATPase
MKLQSKPNNSITSPRSKISVKWLKEDQFNQYVYVLLSVLTLGVLPMLCFFYPNWKIELRSSICAAEASEYALIMIENGTEYLVKVSHFQCQLTEEHLISFEVNGVRFCASSFDNFSLLQVPEVPANFMRFLVPQSIVHRKEILVEERKILAAQYGPNAVSLPEANGLEIFVRHAFSPFYLFQYFAATVWLIEDYVLYAVLILLITIAAVIITTQETLFNLERLRNLAGQEGEVDILDIPVNAASMSSVYDPSKRLKINDASLTPGDQFVVAPGQSVPCDAILIAGRVVVDESMLTGESIPANKSPIEVSGLEGDSSVLKRGSLYNTHSPSPSNIDITGKILMTELATKRSGNVLFSGTKVRACHGGVCIAVCYRTGFRSAKGQLIASLLNPKEGFMNFISDALLVIFCMLILTTILYIVVAIELASMGVSSNIIVLRYFDAVTIAVPPALTACLTVATAISIGRLKKKDIFVSDTTRVNWAGGVSAVCFDKTGTLTEDRLNFQGAYISTLSDSGEYLLKDHGTKPKELPRICLEVMATCHSLAILDISSSTVEEPVGDPLELELVRASGWKLSVSENEGNDKIARMRAQSADGNGYNTIMRHFEFTPDRLRAATLLKRANGRFFYLVKGSPEIIQSLSDPSTVPQDLKSSLTVLTKKGLRVIAMAYRECQEPEDVLMSLSQQQIESAGGINFLGLLTLSSPLKTQTRSTIDQLNRADIHVNMITGDYIHTAIAVAVDCGILASASKNQNTLYIIDERESDGATIIIDAATDQVCNSRVISLERLLDIAALTSILPPAQIKDSTFSMKTRNQHDLSSSSSTNLIPTEGQLQLAVTGRGLISVHRNFKPTTFNALVRYAKVFARTKPADKKTVVDELLLTREIDDRLLLLLKDTDSSSTSQSNESTPLLSSSGSSAPSGSQHGIKKSADEFEEMMKASNERGYYSVLFCGDGANDMSALRAATVGVSLCDTETSVAAPITSRMQTPGSVIDTIVEGRCSLITAYVLILFNIMYGVIQLIMAIMLYSYGLVAGDYMYLTQDLFYTLVLGLAIAMTPPSEFFSKAVPPKRFLTAYLMTKLVFQLVIFVAFQLLALYVLSLQSFYTRFETDDPLSSTYSYEATTIDTMCLAQLMIASVVSTIGEPFRKPWYTNRYHVIALSFQLVWLFFQTFGDNNYFSEKILDLEPLPVYFGFILMSLMIGNAILSWIANSYAESIRPNPYSEKLHLLGKIKTKLSTVTDKAVPPTKDDLTV